MSTKVVYNHKVTTSSTHKTINYLWEPLDLWNIVNFCTVCHQLWLATLKSVVKRLISGGTPYKRRIIRRELCLQCNLGISVQSCLYSFLGMCPPKRIAHPQRLHCERGDFQKHPYWPLFDSQSWPDWWHWPKRGAKDMLASNDMKTTFV